MKETIVVHRHLRFPLFARILFAFLALVGASSLAITLFDIEFGKNNYWDNHGFLFLIFITFFPRLTLLFSSVVTGGILWWIAWLFVPRILVAVLATIAYFNSNPVLVLIAWFVALSGESSEKYVIQSKSQEYRGRGKRLRDVDSEVIN